MLWLILFTIIIVYLPYSYYKYATFWKSRGVPSIWPWPLFGNIGTSLFQMRSVIYYYEDFYMAFPDKRYVGMFQYTRPILVIRDPDLLKKIMVKEFDTFPQHQAVLPDGVDPLWSKNLFAMKGGKKWQDVRSTLSPSFTSSKMKLMFKLIKECSTNFGAHFLRNGETVTIEMKDVFTKFTNDVIATTAFGVTCNSLEEPKNEFYRNGLEISKLGSGLQLLKFILYAMFPNIMKMLKVEVLPKTSKNFFVNVIDSAIKLRKEQSIVRPDMLHLLIEASKGNDIDSDSEECDSGFSTVKEQNSLNERALSDEDIFAQAMIFFLAGFESSSTMLSHATYELALNPDIQDKLWVEVHETLSKCNGDITYESLMGMKYLDMVLSETLRKWPPFAINDREAVRPFSIEPERPGETLLKLNAGQKIFIPVYAIHRDPQYFPNPDKFDPERFSDENKHNIKPFTYLPFGAGPRNCIGSRFGLLEGKLILFEIISKFELIPVQKTKIPLKLGKMAFASPTPDEGFWLGLKPRCNK